MSRVVVTGARGGQTIVHCGTEIRPGTLVTVSEREAEVYAPNVVIVKRLVDNSEPPKPEKKPAPAEVLAQVQQEDAVKRAVVAAEGGRIELGGNKRGK